jgi:hypothetical protein
MATERASRTPHAGPHADPIAKRAATCVVMRSGVQHVARVQRQDFHIAKARSGAAIVTSPLTQGDVAPERPAGGREHSRGSLRALLTCTGRNLSEVTPREAHLCVSEVTTPQPDRGPRNDAGDARGGTGRQLGAGTSPGAGSNRQVEAAGRDPRFAHGVRPMASTANEGARPSVSTPRFNQNRVEGAPAALVAVRESTRTAVESFPGERAGAAAGIVLPHPEPGRLSACIRGGLSSHVRSTL